MLLSKRSSDRLSWKMSALAAKLGLQLAARVKGRVLQGAVQMNGVTSIGPGPPCQAPTGCRQFHQRRDVRPSTAPSCPKRSARETFCHRAAWRHRERRNPEPDAPRPSPVAKARCQRLGAEIAVQIAGAAPSQIRAAPARHRCAARGAMGYHRWLPAASSANARSGKLAGVRRMVPRIRRGNGALISSMSIFRTPPCQRRREGPIRNCSLARWTAPRRVRSSPSARLVARIARHSRRSD
jgi:hypothetical protein